MPHELVSRALAYISSLTTLCLFATSMAIAAINVGKAPMLACAAPVCGAHQVAAVSGDAAGIKVKGALQMALPSKI